MRIVEKETKRGRRYKVTVEGGIDPLTGKRHRIARVVKTKAEAKRIGAKLETEISEGTYVEVQRIKTAPYLTDWLDGMRTQVRPSTWESYERNVRVHVIPRIGALDLQAITTTTLNKIYAELHASGRRKGSGAGLSARTVAYIHTIIHRALSDAAADGLIPATRPPPPGRRSRTTTRSPRR